AWESRLRCSDSKTVPLLREESEMYGGAARIVIEVEFQSLALAPVGAAPFRLPTQLRQGLIVEGCDRLRRHAALGEGFDDAAAGLVEHDAAVRQLLQPRHQRQVGNSRDIGAVTGSTLRARRQCGEAEQSGEGDAVKQHAKHAVSYPSGRLMETQSSRLTAGSA